MSRTIRRKINTTSCIARYCTEFRKVALEYTYVDYDRELGVYFGRPMTKEERKAQFLWLHSDESHHKLLGGYATFIKKHTSTKVRNHAKREIRKWINDGEYEPQLYKSPLYYDRWYFI